MQLHDRNQQLQSKYHRERVPNRDPETNESKDDLALARSCLCLIYLGTNRLKQAIPELEGLTKMSEELTKRYPKNKYYRNGLALSYLLQGRAYVITGQRDLAGHAYLKCSEIAEKLDPWIRAGAYVVMALFVRDNGEPETALTWSDKALAILEKIESNAEVRRSLCETLWLRAEAWTKMGRPQKAMEDFDKALALKVAEVEHSLNLSRAATLRRIGGSLPSLQDQRNYVEAAAEMDRLAEKDSLPPGPGILYTRAVIYSLCRAGALNDGTLRVGAIVASSSVGPLPVLLDLLRRPVEPEKLAEQYGERAVELLKRAQKAAYFKIAANLKYLDEDPFLNSIRDLPEFMELVEKLKSENRPESKENP